jgi:hypothetical protein
VGEFQAVLGDARVTGAEGLGDFRDPFRYVTWEDNTTSAVLSPTTVEEIQDARSRPQQRLRARPSGQGLPAALCSPCVSIQTQQLFARHMPVLALGQHRDLTLPIGVERTFTAITCTFPHHL